MSEYGVTENGFKRKPREKILEDMQMTARHLFGSDINLDSDSVMGKVINLMSWEYAQKWQELENVYNAHFVMTASKQQLDEVCQYVGISRQVPSKAVGEITIYADENTIIPAGFKVETNEPNTRVYETINSDDVQIDSSEEVTIQIRAVDAGQRGNVSEGAITEITNPVSGVEEVYNHVGTAGGRDLESDTELRQRYISSIDRAGGATINSIRATVLEKTDASACLVIENTDIEEDENGLPPKSFETVVLGGTNSDISEAIFSVKPAGIQAFGDNEFTVYDDVGLQKTVGFSRVSRVDIYLEIELTVDVAFEDDGEDKIKENIKSYINDLTISEDVRYTRVISEIHKVDGVLDVDVEIGDNPNNLGFGNVEINFREVARIDEGNIDIYNVIHVG